MKQILLLLSLIAFSVSSLAQSLPELKWTAYFNTDTIQKYEIKEVLLHGEDTVQYKNMDREGRLQREVNGAREVAYNYDETGQLQRRLEVNAQTGVYVETRFEQGVKRFYKHLIPGRLSKESHFYPDGKMKTTTQYDSTKQHFSYVEVNEAGQVLYQKSVDHHKQTIETFQNEYAHGRKTKEERFRRTTAGDTLQYLYRLNGIQKVHVINTGENRSWWRGDNSGNYRSYSESPKDTTREIIKEGRQLFYEHKKVDGSGRFSTEVNTADHRIITRKTFQKGGELEHQAILEYTANGTQLMHRSIYDSRNDTARNVETWYVQDGIVITPYLREVQFDQNSNLRREITYSLPKYRNVKLKKEQLPSGKIQREVIKFPKPEKHPFHFSLRRKKQLPTVIERGRSYYPSGCLPNVRSDRYVGQIEILLPPGENLHLDPETVFAETGGTQSSLQAFIREQLMSMDYPPIALEAGIEGNVYLRVHLDADKRVDSLEVVKGVHPILHQGITRTWKSLDAPAFHFPAANLTLKVKSAQGNIRRRLRNKPVDAFLLQYRFRIRKA